MWLDNNAIPTRGSQIPDHRCLSSTTTKTKFLWKRQKHFELMSTRLNHIHVSLSLSSIIWYWPLVSDVLCRTVTIGIALHWPCVTDLFVSWAQHLSKRDDHATYTAHGVQQSLPVLGRCSTTGLDTTPFVQAVLCQCWSTYTPVDDVVSCLLSLKIFSTKRRSWQHTEHLSTRHYSSRSCCIATRSWVQVVMGRKGNSQTTHSRCLFELSTNSGNLLCITHSITLISWITGRAWDL